MAGKLYAVTAGAYSDYHIVALCSDKERATKICDMYNGNDIGSMWGAKVEEFDDGIQTDIDMPLYKIELSSSGKCKISECWGEEKVDTMLDRQYAWRLNVLDSCGDLMIYVFADNMDMALKIARDKFAQYKAEHEGVI